MKVLQTESELLWIQVDVGNGDKVLVGAYYRSHIDDQHSIWWAKPSIEETEWGNKISYLDVSEALCIHKASDPDEISTWFLTRLTHINSKNWNNLPYRKKLQINFKNLIN